LAPDGVRTFMRRGDLQAPVGPVPLVGIKPGPGETWLQIGRNFAIVITGVTALAVLLPAAQGGALDLGRLVGLVPFILLFALTNTIAEEAIFRLGLVATLAGQVDPRSIALLSGAIFGSVHFLGTPGGPLGVVLAGFLGWLLAKSILETRGVQWALTIHFLQDVVIFSAILVVAT
ncbi:MAG: CPBP family intramembrane metalloprotease, partial [Chloroflexota bacterium]|nr:CPBP family intramembrane metalloprotease [Chloroflexota bacterium]